MDIDWTTMQDALGLGAEDVISDTFQRDPLAALKQLTTTEEGRAHIRRLTIGVDSLSKAFATDTDNAKQPATERARRAGDSAHRAFDERVRQRQQRRDKGVPERAR
jgi:hypothetical protein